MSICVITVVPLPYPTTLGNGAARQVGDMPADGDIDVVVHRLSGFKVSKSLGVSGRAVIWASCAEE
jgi:hypothetical protein